LVLKKFFLIGNSILDLKIVREEFSFMEVKPFDEVIETLNAWRKKKQKKKEEDEVEDVEDDENDQS